MEDCLNKLDKQVHKYQEELRLLKAEALNKDEEAHMLDIRGLRGLGRELWKGIDAKEYIQKERDSWE
ncbi:hypothetical protein KKH50_04560 [Patescibacteria group bacterium]|nr:hypothetical protein [Bacteroidota bacterium]MBU1967527.1 hypothetical protein [Patescibacteria group bacterium]